MSFNNRREFLFLYSVKDANPNGDPLNANHPRFDAESGQILVSDVRIKRTIRDQWLREGLEVFVDGEAKTLSNRVKEIEKNNNVKNGKDALACCIDARLFGATYAVGKESFSWTGPVQFKWGRSLHQAKAELVQGTGAFVTTEGNQQRTFRNEYIVPFVLLAVYGIANQNGSEITGASDEDINQLSPALWQGTNNLITRSKIGHIAQLLLEIRYKEGFQGIIGALDEKISLTKDGSPLDEDAQLKLRSVSEVTLDLSKLVDEIRSLDEKIESVNLSIEKGLSLNGLDDLKQNLAERLTIEEK